MNKQSLIVKIFGIISLLMGIWFCVQNISYYFMGQIMSIYKWALHSIGAILYILCGIGLLRFKNWARITFMVLMVYYLYRQITLWQIFLYRIKQGYIFSLGVESIIALLGLVSILFPCVALVILNLKKIKENFLRR